MKADFNTTCRLTIGRDAHGIPDESLTEFASHNKSPTLKGMFRSLVPRHVEETSNASADLCSSRNRRERRTSPTDPASSSPGSFYVTALWSSCASSPTLSTHRTSPTPQINPRERKHTVSSLTCMHCILYCCIFWSVISALASTCNLLKVLYFFSRSSHGFTTLALRRERACILQSVTPQKNRSVISS